MSSGVLNSSGGGVLVGLRQGSALKHETATSVWIILFDKELENMQCFVMLQYGSRVKGKSCLIAIDLHHAVTILFMFPVSNKSNECLHSLRMAPDYYFVQPQFGYNELEWSKIKMATL